MWHHLLFVNNIVNLYLLICILKVCVQLAVIGYFFRGLSIGVTIQYMFIMFLTAV